MSDDVLYLRNDDTGTKVKIAKRVSGVWHPYPMMDDTALSNFLWNLGCVEATSFGLISEMHGLIPKQEEPK